MIDLPRDKAEEASRSTVLLDVSDLSVSFWHRGRLVRAVSEVSYRVEAGRTLGIVGESGSGKTVSSRALMRLLPRTATVTGSVRLDGVDLLALTAHELRRRRGADLAMIFQDPGRTLNPTMTVGRQIEEAIRIHLRVTRREARASAIELLQLVRIPAAGQRYHEYPHQLSGGMRQRVVIAIALACHPKLLIADEATTALDVTTQAQIMELLMALQEELGMALIMITHDMALAATYTDDLLVMYGGRIVEKAASSSLFSDVRMPYTRALLDAVPRIDSKPHSLLPAVAGRPPDLGALPAGCAFATRCAYAEDDCRVAVPPLSEHDEGHWWACIHPLPTSGLVR